MKTKEGQGLKTRTGAQLHSCSLGPLGAQGTDLRMVQWTAGLALGLVACVVCTRGMGSQGTQGTFQEERLGISKSGVQFKSCLTPTPRNLFSELAAPVSFHNTTSFHKTTFSVCEAWTPLSVT